MNIIKHLRERPPFWWATLGLFIVPAALSVFIPIRRPDLIFGLWFTIPSCFATFYLVFRDRNVTAEEYNERQESFNKKCQDEEMEEYRRRYRK